jgi:rhodanese-related sulfurtransferase/predicted metal-dependent enzyme (double-stranded beta helix superfamily)
MSVHEARAAAVAATLAQVRGIEAELGATPAALERCKGLLTALASRSELFPPEHFPVNGGHGTVYRLSEDPDRRFALYASAGVPGKKAPPHNHTTWAVISGVYGEEHNVRYERTDNRGVQGEGTLRRLDEITVRPGNAVAFLPDEFHTIEVLGDKPSLHLHMYGLSLECLPERVTFGTEAGGSYRVYPAPPNIQVPLVGARELKAMLTDGQELALIDPREEGVFYRRHLLFANCVPLSHLETRITSLIPRAGTRIVLCDAGEGLVQRAAAKLSRYGYNNVSVLQGGVEGWAQAGYELFSGVNVPSKAFGEFVEHHDDTPRIDAKDLQAKVAAGEKLVILDSRPMDEFHRMSIPGGIDCPGAELVYRTPELVKDPDTLVIVNCAGRTRSIIGAQSLINAGLPNKVMALKNGTMGWHLAGLEVARGETRHAPKPGPEALAKARAMAEQVAQRFGVKRIDRAGLARLEAERESRSLYLFDVRSPGEYQAGHLAAARSAPGGQLVQATDQYVGTRNARIVLIDDDGVRAPMTAHWLVQMAWDEVFVLADAMRDQPLVIGPEQPPVHGLGAVDTITPAELKAQLDNQGAVVVDLDSSLRYRDGHVPGAWWAVRARLADSAKKLPDRKLVVLTSPDGLLARLAAAEAAAATGRPVRVLAGGTRAWSASGLPLERGTTHMADEPNDVWYKPYDHETGREERMNEYLSWEVDLVAQIERDGDARFRTFAKA